jgi:hypothetical protein
MTKLTPRPPLPSPLSHEGITFVLDRSLAGELPSSEVIAAIAVALHEMLPTGDIVVDADGVVHIQGVPAQQHPVSLWYQAGLLAGIERSSL